MNKKIENSNINNFGPVAIETVPPSPMSQLPDELLLHIFSFLLPEELGKCALISRTWQRVSQDNLLWKSKYDPDVIDDFSSVVKQNILIWKEVRLYARLSKLMARSMEYRYHRDNFIILENPELKNVFPSLAILKNFVRYGDYSFSVSHTTDVKIYKKGEIEPTILPGEKDMTLIYLEVEGDYLFALRRDGMIIQWNYKTKEKINKIETAYTKKHPSLNELISENYFSLNGCCVKNGLLVLKYGMEVVEIIPYATPEKSQVIEDPSLPPSFLNQHRITIENDRIFILGRKDIWIWDLLTNKRDSLIKVNMDSSHLIFDIALEKQFIYAFDTAGDLHIVNLTTKTQNKFSLPSDYTSSRIAVIGNLLCGYDSEKRSITILDMNSKTVIGKIKCDFDFLKIESTTLSDLVKIVKANLRPTDSQVWEEENNQEEKNSSQWCLIS